jgi:integrase
MRQRYRLFRRSSGIFFIEDRATRRQESLRTKDKEVASRLFHSKNEAHVQPALNLQIARAYLMAIDPAIATRTWQHALDEIIKTKQGGTQVRWLSAAKQKPFDTIRNVPILETQAEHFLKVLNSGTVSTNVYLRRLHNFALDMSWLPWPVIPKRQWPEVRFKEKRAITWEEHLKIIEREQNVERRAFYELCWHLGGSQSDIAHLQTEDIDWQEWALSYSRKKTSVPVIIHFGEAAAKVLRTLPASGSLFPYLMTVRAGDRATEFKQRCQGLGIKGVSLHSYRYSWAERAKKCGYPERFAQQALGHSSKAVHRAYAKKVQVKLPSMEEYEKAMEQKKVVAVKFQSGDQNQNAAVP